MKLGARGVVVVCKLVTLSIAFALASLPARAEEAWRELDADNTLVIETGRGPIVIELRPELAPNAVERIKLLARERVYDGLQFHRVIDGFVAQTGNPNNRDGGGSAHPDLAPEFTFAIPPDAIIATTSSDGVSGFVGATPFQGAGKRGWGAHCAGAVGMGRQDAPNSANSEIYILRAPARRLDHDYTIVGRVVAGLEIVRALPVGEPPATPEIVRSARIVSDLTAAERPRVQRMDTNTAAFRTLLEQARARGQADFTICDMEIPIRITP
ncbi:peptidylprolyl isomerase [Roseiterribacter gracilis]|uniref:peptidylprolyl isomerase n=1 Tax=Roseiterribacter gracilis TaxID=2812848 RepID=UPI003B42C1C5